MAEQTPPDAPPDSGSGAAPAPTQGRVRAEPLAVAPQLVGARLATPGRRGAALLIDLAVIGALSQASSWGLVLALVVLAALVHHALAADGARPWLARGIAGVILLGALAVGWSAQRQQAGEPWAASVKAAVEAAEEALASASDPATAGQSGSEVQLRGLIEQLEQLQREHRPTSLAERLDAAVAELGMGFGWGMVYFSLLPALWPGRTLGKALLKLRIAELSGRPLTPLRALKRYGGYAAGIATGGLGFVQALWDPNRQCLHDKAAHTVVLDERTGVQDGPAG